MTVPEPCDVGPCEAAATVEVVAEPIGRRGFRRGRACPEHATRVAAWVVDIDSPPGELVATFNHETREWTPISEVTP